MPPSPTIHLDNCGGSPMPPRAHAALTEFLALETDIGPYRAADQMQPELAQVYTNLGLMVGATADTIAITQSATQAWLQAFYALDLQAGDEVLLHDGEYRANVIALEFAAQKLGISFKVMGSNANGVDLHQLEAAITANTKLIALTWLPSNDGLINPAAGVGKIAKAHNIPYLLDACQAVGQMPVDVSELNCTFLTATGRKFMRAPRGTGFLYVAPAWNQRLEPLFRDQQSDAYPHDARRFELFERNFGNMLALGAAAETALEIGLHVIQARIHQTSARVRRHLQDHTALTCHDSGADNSGIVTFSVNGKTPDAVKSALWNKCHITSSVSGQAFAPLDQTKPALFNRIGIHHFNTDDEISLFLNQLDDLT